MKKIGLFDLDGVIANTNVAIEKYVKLRWNINLKITPEHLSSYFIENWGIGLDSTMSIQMFGDPKFYQMETPIIGSLVALRNLRGAGFKIHIVTARPLTKSVRTVTEKWLKDFNVPHDSLYVVKAPEKAQVLAHEKCSFFIEDSPKNVLEIAPFSELGFAIDLPFMPDKLPKNVIKVEDLYAAANILTNDRKISGKFKEEKNEQKRSKSIR